MTELIDVGKPSCVPDEPGGTARRHGRGPAMAIAIALVGSVVGTTALAQALTPPAGGAYVLRKQAIASGGQRVQGGAYVLTGTVGQAQVDPSPATAATYRLAGGFHTPAMTLGDDLFANGFEN